MIERSAPSRSFSAIVAAALLLALTAIVLYAPREAVQGDAQKIIYVHVGSAAAAYLSFLVTAGASIGTLIWRSERMDRVARSAALVGVFFTTAVLASGAIWGRAVWGVWWTWDAKLTTTLVMWFVQAGYLLLRSWVDQPQLRQRLAAYAGLLGLAIVPVNYMAAYWWRTLHPPPTVVAPDSPGLPPAMAHTLIVAAIAVLLLWGWMLWLQIGIERATDEIEGTA